MQGTVESVERIERWWESDDRREGDAERVLRLVADLDAKLVRHTHQYIELLSTRGERCAFLLGHGLVAVVEFFPDGDDMVYDVLSLYRDEDLKDDVWSLP